MLRHTTQIGKTMPIHSLHENTKRFVHWLVITLLILSTSCTRGITISNVDFHDAERDGNTVYRVKTSDNQTYEFKQYIFVEDTLVIFNPFDPDLLDPKKQGADTISLPLDTIESIEKVEWNKTSTAITVIAGVAIAVTLFIIGSIFSGLGSFE